MGLITLTHCDIPYALLMHTHTRTCTQGAWCAIVAALFLTMFVGLACLQEICNTWYRNWTAWNWNRTISTVFKEKSGSHVNITAAEQFEKEMEFVLM